MLQRMATKIRYNATVQQCNELPLETESEDSHFCEEHLVVIESALIQK